MTILQVEAKSILTSKLFWLGIIETVMGVLGLLRDFLSAAPVAEAATLVGPVAVPDPSYANIVLTAIGLLTMVFRTKTNRPVALRKQVVEVNRLVD